MAEMVVVSEEIESKIKLLFSKPSTPYSTSVTMQPLSASGRLTIFQHSAHIAPGREGLFNLYQEHPANAEI